jgi:hypothetical protein
MEIVLRNNKIWGNVSKCYKKYALSIKKRKKIVVSLLINKIQLKKLNKILALSIPKYLKTQKNWHKIYLIFMIDYNWVNKSDHQ